MSYPRRKQEQPRGKASTAWRKVSGRADLDRAMDERYEPYGYESNANLARWVAVGMALWILLLLGLALSDRATSSMLARWEDEGFTAAPSESPYPEDLFLFARAQGLACTTGEDMVNLGPDCERLLSFRSEVASAGDRGSWFTLALVVLLLVLAFIFSLFTHRASRNLLPLKAEGQRFSPEWAVACFYVPFINLIRPFQVFIELFAGSGPYRAAQDTRAWRRAMPPAVVIGWWMTVLASFALNPLVLGLFIGDETLADARVTASASAWIDAWLIVPAIMATLVAYALHRRQEARFADVGPNTVTRPPPELPF